MSSPVLEVQERASSALQVGNSLIHSSLFRSESLILKSDRERFAQVTHDKRATERFALFHALSLTKTSESLEKPMSDFPTCLQVVRLLAKGEEQLDLAALYAGELNPVGPKAQKKVPVPEGLGKQTHFMYSGRPRN